MTISIKLKLFQVIVAIITVSVALSDELPDGFVYISEIDPTIRVNLKYFNGDNFVGDQITGYLANRGIMTTEAALALSKAQKIFNSKGYCILLYDSYRPQRAVNHFVEWIENDDIRNKEYYYPRVDKKDFIDLGYFALKSGHTRGSTVDITIIRCNTPHLLKAYPVKRTFNDIELTMMYDNSIDTGTAFDLMDLSSHVTNTIVSETHKSNRNLIIETMKEVGFTVLEEEWWHYTFQPEPFPDTYFDFPVE